MTVGTAGDKTRQYKAAVVAAAELVCRPLEAVGHGLLVRYGAPSLQQLNNFDDIVAVTAMSTQVEQGPMGPRHPKHLTMQATVVISTWRKGVDGDDDSPAGDALERAASDAAYALLDALEEYARATDPQLGGVVLDWWCTSHESDGETDRSVIARGRAIQIDAIFTAHARVTTTS